MWCRDNVRYVETPMNMSHLRVSPEKRRRKALILWDMVGGTGIEPVTPSMSTKCSPAELTARDARVESRIIPAVAPRNPYGRVKKEVRG